MKQFKKRFKPEDPNHDNYSEEELSKLIHYFREKKDKDSYDYAIWFALNSCLRIGEIRSLKYSNFSDNTYRVDCATSNIPEMSFDENNNIVFGKAIPKETFVKGNTSFGFRNMPITSDIARIVSELKSKYPYNKPLYV